MTTNPEQIRPQDLQREAIEQPQPTPEKPEPTEADFEKITQQAESAVSNDETRVLDSANQRLEKAPASVGLDSKKAESIFSSGGFADRINSTEQQIKQLGQETSLKINNLSQPDKLRQFTKQYSGFWRNQLAEKIRDFRKQTAEKKNSVQTQNLEHSAKRDSLQSEIANTKKELDELKTELENRKVKLEEEKNRLISRVARLFSKNKEIPEETIVKELQSKSEQLNAGLEEKKKLLGEFGAIVLDGSEMEQAKNEIRKFYEEQKDIHGVFENEKTKERNIASISKEKGVLFLHTLPIDSYGMSNTSGNNPNVDTEKMTSIDKTRMVLGIEPTISVSTINLRGEKTEDKFQTMYPIGLIIGEGTALSAYGGDAGTYADNPFVRRSKYDRSLKSAVQENFTANMEGAIKGESGQATMQMGYNEVVIENPKVSGIFLDVTRLRVGQDITKSIDAMKQAFSMSKEFGLPIYDINPNGEMNELSSDAFVSVTQEKVLAYKCELGVEEKVDGVEKVLKTQEKPNIEIQRKLSHIQKRENSDGDFLQAQEKRAVYSKKSEECLNALEYENIAKYMGRTINRLGDVGFDEILRVAQSEGINERGLEKINLLFGAKTTSEIISISKSITQKADFLKSLFDTK